MSLREKKKKKKEKKRPKRKTLSFAERESNLLMKLTFITINAISARKTSNLGGKFFEDWKAESSLGNGAEPGTLDNTSSPSLFDMLPFAGEDGVD